MSQPQALELRTFPSRIADLGFAVPLPVGWIAHELPGEEPDFSNPTFFLPLAIVTAPHAAIVYAFAARPAYDDGTLQDWAVYLLSHNQLRPQILGPGRVGTLPAIVGEAVQDSEMGPMRVRFAFIEDGKRLLNLTLSAPEMLADVLKDAWGALLASFTLETPRGPTPGTMPAGGDAVMAPTEAPKAAAPDAAAAESVAPTDPSSAPPTSKPANTFAQHALADDAASLDPEARINANLRDRGVGLVPRVVATNDLTKQASVAAGSVLAQFDVPYGWHVLDDGRRVLVFEPTSRVQIHLHPLAREGRSNAAILDDLEAQMRTDYPNPEFVRLKEGRIHALGARNIHDGEQPLEQYHFLFPGRDQQTLLRARITATPETATAACNLAELILESVAFDCVMTQDEPTAKPRGSAARRDPPPPTASSSVSNDPEWWQAAMALEEANELEAAEQLIRKRIDHQAFAHAIASLYRRRMQRLQKEGDDAGARAAFDKADYWICFYASQATSGGEGAALSEERDEFRAQLVNEYGNARDRLP